MLPTCKKRDVPGTFLSFSRTLPVLAKHYRDDNAKTPSRLTESCTTSYHRNVRTVIN